MDVNYNLLKLKLDMVYRSMPMEEAAKKYAEITQTVQVGTVVEEKKPPVRRVVKAIIPKSKK
jgi:hypothetical protein